MLNKKSSKDRLKSEINAGSMADIAFLLLIFFLVTTTIDVDKGISIKLPPWSEDDVQAETLKLKTRNVFSVLVNANNQMLVRGELADVANVRERAKEFIANPSKRDDLSESPRSAIISLKNDRGTNYKTYLMVYNELKAAYSELWDDKAQAKFGKPYGDDLTDAQKKQVRDEIPFILSEAEPTAFGEE